MSAFSMQRESEKLVYVLDAGHGGEDGGAVSPDGAKESDVNLAVVLDLDALLRFLGQETVLTRTEDASIASEDAQTLREKKVSDLKNRVALVNSIPRAVLVSIHQNSLPSVPSVRGAQVFFGKNAPSDAIAASMQCVLNKTINAGREKHEKKIDSTIYLMKNVNCPAILIECGFMSNASEAAALQDSMYQRKLAAAIAAGLLDHGNVKTEGEFTP
ncbi:MAG: N-acetylmuramoyl-L-alanine amidase [Oscillospiraceae bacterium]|nr:N-acetylmuramoyl-L-alanine amidase [Oscillospiraceae bacterium]